MKTRMAIFGITLIIALAVAIGSAPAQEGKEQKKEKQAGTDMEAMQKAWAEAMTPGEHHQHLAQMVGSWTYVAKMWMDPSAPPTETKGTSEFKMILGGRYLQQEVFGEYMGEEFHGIGLAGYDNTSKKYQSVWIDNTGTMIMTMTGTCEQGGQVHTSYGKHMDPISGEMKKLKSVTTMKGKDKILDEMFEIGPDGREIKTMELIYTRK